MCIFSCIGQLYITMSFSPKPTKSPVVSKIYFSGMVRRYKYKAISAKSTEIKYSSKILLAI